MQKKDKMNNRGDIATMVLVIGVFLVCGVAIFSFVFFNSYDRQSFANSLEIMASVNSIAEQVRFYENTGMQPEKILNITKQSDFYNSTLEKREGDKRLFYVEYKLAIGNPLAVNTP